MTTIDEKTEALGIQCRSLSGAAVEALDWLEHARHSSVAVAQQSVALEGTLRRIQNASERLGRAAGRRMCVGVFGASQAGKSYLVNSLARGNETSFKVRLGQDTFDFLNQINPQNESESTGLVSRFSAKYEDKDPDYPIALRLLTEMDLVKILVNSCQEDVLHDQTKEFDLPNAEATRAALAKAAEAAGDPDSDRPTSAEIFDLREYVHDHYRKRYGEITASGYWERLATLAPRLPLSGRAEIFSLLWGSNINFTRLFLQLAEASNTLNRALDARCAIDALLQPRPDGGWARHTKSILNVTTLFQLGLDTQDLLKVVPIRDGKPCGEVSLPRSLVTALTAELQLGLGSDYYDFFRNADLLDFPGVRGRLGAHSFEAGGKQPGEKGGPAQDVNAGANFFLRGKVEYLFQRYEAERELTAMLLCVAGSNQEVTVLGEMVHSWVERTLGATPQARSRSPNTLFFIMTKFDNEFGQTMGQDENSQRKRFDARVSEGLLKLWERRGWTADWDGTGPFRNSYWLRNPAFLRRDLMTIDEDLRETGILDDMRGFIATMRRYCVESELVQQHMADPGRAFDEAMKLNDGGVSYIVERLTEICAPDLKLRQVSERLFDEARTFDKALRRFYDDAGADQREGRAKLAEKTMFGLRDCIANQRFGELLAALQFSMEDIWPIHAVVGVASDDELAGNSRNSVAVGSAEIDIDSIFEGFESIDETAGDAPEAGAGAVLMDRANRFANDVLQHWVEEILRLSGEEIIQRRLMVKSETLGEIAQELAKSTERTQLRVRIADHVRQETSNANAQWDQVGPRAVAIAHRMLSDHVAWLGLDSQPRSQRPSVPVKGGEPRVVFDDPDPVLDLPNLPEKQQSVPTFLPDWLHAYRHLVVENAGFIGGGLLTAEENDKLGDILRKVPAVPQKGASA